MKRLTLLLTLTVCAVLLASATVFVQERLRPQLGERDDAPQRITDPESLPKTFLNQNRLHKLILNADDQAVYEDLAARRFSLIVSERLFTPIKDSSCEFGEENNAWVTWVANPILCYYEEKITVKEIGIQLLVPKSGQVNCSDQLP